MFKKKDLLLFLLVLALAGVLFLLQYINAKNTTVLGIVRIWADGKIYREAALGKEETIVIRQDNGCENVVRLTENGFFMESANCHNQLCIGQGEVTTENYPLRSLGTHVLCLPNRVDVELVVENSTDMDIPDI
ncbi:MAG: NusG domain II-containing protein [Clostridia bacterium]|nr:NusG domain II-containing protein [Clostridia bacterium]